MKRTILMTLTLFGLAGCVTAPVAIAPSAAPVRPDVVRVLARPEQVTPQNAEKMSQVLARELDLEAQTEITGTSPSKR